MKLLRVGLTGHERPVVSQDGITGYDLSGRLPGDAPTVGYPISNDVSERESQRERGGQWDKGKNCETFNPLGPWISTADMIFGVFHLVWYISQFMALLPGDVVNTGTHHGVGAGFSPPRFLRAGDLVEVAIAGLGRQRDRLRDYAPAPVPA